jgi:cation diffusion facilitator CzcD-associated flavoprotein CzcO
MSMLPIFLKLDGRRCLLVGAGNVALDKVNSLLKTGAPATGLRRRGGRPAFNSAWSPQARAVKSSS